MKLLSQLFAKDNLQLCGEIVGGTFLLTFIMYLIMLSTFVYGG